MGKEDIEDWIAAAGSSGNDADEEDQSASWADARNDWPRFMESAQIIMHSSSTKARTLFMEEVLLPLAKSELDRTERLNLFQLITSTYSRYHDQQSRKSVEGVLCELCKEERGLTEPAIRWILAEARRSTPTSWTSSTTSRYVLLSWSCRLYQELLSSNASFQSTPSWPLLLESMALLLDSLVDLNSEARRSIRQQSVSLCRKALSLKRELLPEVASECLKSAKSSLRFVPLLGVACDISSTTLSQSMKADILQLYTSSFMMSKTPVAQHILISLVGFIKSAVSADDLKTTLMPVMEKASLRSPEVALPVMTEFFACYSHPVTDESFRRATTVILNGSKSSNPATRTNAVVLFKTLIGRNPDEHNSEHAINEILGPARSGKTSGPDHRLALYSMLTSIPPSSIVSEVMAETSPTLIVKETNDAAQLLLSQNSASHFIFLLNEGIGLPKDAVQIISREMAGSKPTLRKAMCMLGGSIVWGCRDACSPAVESFINMLLPSLESNLKAVVSNPLGSTAGPLEGYIAIACLLGSISNDKNFDSSVSKIVTVQSLVGSRQKPSFLLWDKVYQKLIGTEEQEWLLRAIHSAFPHLKKELEKHEFLRIQMGLAFIHLMLLPSGAEIHRSTNKTLESQNKTCSSLTNQIIRESLLSFLVKHARTPEIEPSGSAKLSPLMSLLKTCATFDDSTGTHEREALIAQLILHAHHPSLCGKSQQLWIDLCQQSSVDPRQLVINNATGILQTIAASHNKGEIDSEVIRRAVQTLVFVAPDVVLPQLVSQIKSDLDPVTLSSLTETDIAIWETPEGTAYVDVFSGKDKQGSMAKGKDAALARWDAEVRSSLATKKPQKTAPTLSKQEKELVDAQLLKESLVRDRLSVLRNNIQRGLDFIKGIIDAGVSDLDDHFLSLATLLLDGVVKVSPSFLGTMAFDSYLDIGRYISTRLQGLQRWIGIAIIRCLNPDIVPEELKEEMLNSLVLRVVYRLRSLAEQSPFNCATFSYIVPLLSSVVCFEVNPDQEEELAELIALSIDIMRFNGGEFRDTRFPRSQSIHDLLAVIKRHPTFGKDAATALVTIAEAMRVNASGEEVAIFIKATIAQEAYLRNACLQCLQVLDVTDLDWSPELFVACYDSDQQNARLATNIWEENGLDVPESFFRDLQPFLDHEHANVRNACASSLTDAVSHWPQSVTDVLDRLQEMYREKVKAEVPEVDEFGVQRSRFVEKQDHWPARLAVAQSFEALAPVLTDDLVVPFMGFLVEEQVLGDENQRVRSGMLSAASEVVDLHGSRHIPELTAMFEKYISTSTGRSESSDYVKEAVVVLLGRTARHMEIGDARIPSVVSRLIEALKTPSEQVQLAVSECLAPLVAFFKSDVDRLVDELITQLFQGQKYGERRGAAYGLAGIVKGAGIASITDLNILERLRNAMEDKKRYESRQGAMFAIETLSATLGRNFEPYIIELLSSLLASFGDSSPDVREATEDAAKVIMGNMSAYGVKCILPSLLSALEEKQWRTKKGSIELLGTMAFCAPKQLSVSLPTVIPKLSGVLTDSHAQVRSSANRSLKQFGEVISNPEIQSLVPTLLKALGDPAKTPNAMSSLLKKSFAHYIDSPSLALVIPVVERGLRERGSDTKRKAAQIVGNLASLTDSQDFVPYLSRLLPLVHVVLVDPVPEARATAAKALGTLVERLGEEQFPDMVPNLLKVLKTDTSGVDRQGAAQGLSEVLAGLGMERLEALLPDIVSNAQSPRSTVREGFMSLLVYLPATFGVRFQPHLTKIVGPILAGLSDTEEYVREAAMKAGRMIINNYSKQAIDLLLPELERGLFDSSWRIRHSSITLVGELLFKVTGVSGKAEIEEDEEAVHTTVIEISKKVLTDSLGDDRRDRVLSALYIVRQDAVAVVRQSAVHIWKVLVQNTPRTIRELLPELVKQLIYLLVDKFGDSQETASRTMGELCRKLGERILGEMLPILKASSESSDSRTREGSCLALVEIMESATDTQRESHDDDIVLIVRAALVDEDSSVRAAAAQAFDSLQEHLGGKAIDQTIPTLLEALRQPGQSSGTALQALKEVMNVRANSVFPVLIPTLLSSPMTVFNARAFASLVTVAGGALSKRLTQVLSSLVSFSEQSEDEELSSALNEAIRALLGSISDAEGLNALMMLLFEWAKIGSPIRRASACRFLGVFCEESDLDDSLYRVDWVRQLVMLLDDYEAIVHTAALQAFDTFIKSVPKDELDPLVVSLRRTIETTGGPGRVVPGFSLPKGVQPMVPVIIAGLTTGSNEQRENAAYAIGDLVTRTDEASIKPFVVPFTGPLIRVAAQSTTYPPGVKSAIMSSLTIMLEKIPSLVKPFFPQLQRTFIKAVSDPSSGSVRTRAATALGVLMRSQPRVDPVVTEIVAGVKANEDSIAASHITALALIVKNAGEHLGDKTREACVEVLDDAFKESHNESYVQSAASLFAELTRFPDLVRHIIDSHLLAGTPPSALSSNAILAVFEKASEDEQGGDGHIFGRLGLLASVSRKVQESIGTDKSNISRPAREAKELMAKLED